MTAHARPCALALLWALCACNNNGQTVDSSATDGPPGGGEASVADGRTDRGRDLGPDGPRAPAKWKTVSGTAPQLEDHAATLLKSGDVLVCGGDQYDGTNDQYQDKAYRYAVSQDTFVDAGKMTTPRARHTATLLDSGKVLVTGGKNTGNYLKSTELWDPQQPVASSWSAGPDMFESRWDHAATKLKNGKVLISGGFVSSNSTSTITLYDPATNSFQTPAAAMNEARRAHTATLLGNGKVLFAGGIQGASSSTFGTTYLDSLEIYDPQSGTMTSSKVKMSKKRVAHTATLMNDGKVLIVGGFCGNNCTGGQEVNDVYDPATDSIAKVSHPGVLPAAHVAELLLDGRVLVAGDNDDTTSSKVVAYAPSGGGMWSTLPSMSVGRWSAVSVKLTGGTVLVVGGVKSSSPTYTYATTAERFYP